MRYRNKHSEIYNLHCSLHPVIGCIPSQNNDMNTHTASEELDKTSRLFPEVFFLVPTTIYFNREKWAIYKSAYTLCFPLLALPSFHFFCGCLSLILLFLGQSRPPLPQSLCMCTKIILVLLSLESLSSSSTSSLNKRCTVR